jgi:hypothetical protein
MIEELRPVLRSVASGLGAKTAADRSVVLEAVGVAALVESGWVAVVARPKQADPREFL